MITDVLLYIMLLEIQILGKFYLFQLIYYLYLFIEYFRQVCLLLKRGADPSITNQSDEDALSIALDKACADIVTVYVNLMKTKNPIQLIINIYFLIG